MATPNLDTGSPRLARDSQTSSPSTTSAVALPSAASWSPSVPSVSSGDTSRPSARRGKITQIACVPCRQRKSKCDGARPECVACQGRPNVKCVYDVTLDQRKPSSLRQRVGELEQEVCNLKDIFELLSNELPEKLKIRFRDLVQQIDDGGLSDELVAQLRARLAMPQTPNELHPLQSYTQQMGNTDAKFSIGSDSQVPGNSMQNPYFFDFSSVEDQQTPDANMFGNPADMGLAIPMPVDGAGIGTSYWKLQSMQAPPWSLASGEPSEGGRAVTAPLNPQLPQDYRWLLSSGNPLRTLNLYGKVDGSPNRAPVDFDTHVPVYLVQPINEVDPKPLSGMYSGVYTAYRDSKRQFIESGIAESNVLGGDGIDYGPAVQPTNFDKELPLSTWAPELLGAHRNLRASDRVACAWMLSTMMRWQISPKRQTYEDLPAWLRPTPKQCFVPHSANLDFLPWPQIRDSLMDVAAEAPEVTVNALSVNWPNSDDEIIYLDETSNKFALRPDFYTHVSNLSNWTLPASLLRQMPGLQGSARFDNDR